MIEIEGHDRSGKRKLDVYLSFHASAGRGIGGSGKALALRNARGASQRSQVGETLAGPITATNLRTFPALSRSRISRLSIIAPRAVDL
jgi:hypothetical protein